LDITIVPSYVVFGSESYRDGVELTKQQFYEKLSTTHEIPKTAAPSPAVYAEAYHRLVKETDQIVSIHLAANLSSLYDVAILAAETISEAQVAVVDSQQVTMGYGWMAIAAAEAARRGETLEKVVTLVEGMRERSFVMAVLDTLDFLHRGGRVGWVTAMIGTLLQIKPIIRVWKGKVELLGRARTRTRSLGQLVDMVEALGPLERAMILHTNAPDLAEQLANRLQATIPGWEPRIGQAGVTIASHTGPGAVGIACVAARHD
jgi:DegV family protein with EDD domain